MSLCDNALLCYLNYKIESKQSKNYLYTITRENVFEQIKSK